MKHPRTEDSTHQQAVKGVAASIVHTASTVVSTDESLLEAYRLGDKKAFTQLVERYQKELFLFLVRFLSDRVAAEDIFQETFLQVHQSADQFDTDRRFRPWLFTIAANKARDYMRSKSRKPTSSLQASVDGDSDGSQFIDMLQSPDGKPEDALQRQELQARIRSTVHAMPDNLREILLLSYFQEFSYQQISDMLDIPLGTVKSRLHSAVAHFAEKWRIINSSENLNRPKRRNV